MNDRRIAWLSGIAALLTALPVAAGDGTVIRLSEPVAVSDDAETFGALIDEDATRVRLGDLLENPESFVGKPILTSARVSQVCQKKGCFFIAKDGATTIRVSFKDYGFFVPTDAGGKQVTLSGELVETRLSEEQVEHFAADLEVDRDEVADWPVYEIVASAVRIPRS